MYRKALQTLQDKVRAGLENSTLHDNGNMDCPSPESFPAVEQSTYPDEQNMNGEHAEAQEHPEVPNSVVDQVMTDDYAGAEHEYPEPSSIAVDYSMTQDYIGSDEENAEAQAPLVADDQPMGNDYPGSDDGDDHTDYPESIEDENEDGAWTPYDPAKHTPSQQQGALDHRIVYYDDDARRCRSPYPNI